MSSIEEKLSVAEKRIEQLIKNEFGECDKNSDLYSDCMLVTIESLSKEYKCPWTSLYHKKVKYLIEKYKRHSAFEITADLEECEDTNSDLEDEIMLKQDIEYVKLLMAYLTPREQKVIEARFGLKDGICRTYEEVGKKYSVTRERIRQIERRALRKLRVLCATQLKLRG